MADYSKVKSKFIMLLGADYDGDEVLDYDGFVKNAVDCTVLEINEELLEDERVIFYCAAKALYELRLVESMGADYVTSFKAGDISFDRSSSCLEQAEKLLEKAQSQCKGIFVDKSFSFKAV